jgi:hypothetical protein
MFYTLFYPQHSFFGGFVLLLCGEKQNPELRAQLELACTGNWSTNNHKSVPEQQAVRNTLPE